MISKKVKTVITAVVLGSFIVCVPTVALAETEVYQKDFKEISIVSPRLRYIVESMCDLSITGNIATVDCWVNGQYEEATKAKVIAELQVKSGSNWIAYGTWTDIQNSYEASVYETKSVKSGNTYRVKATVTVWEGSQSEQLILFTDEMTA